MLKQFKRAEVARLLDIKESQLRYWARIDLVKPSIQEGGRSFYDFQDLICLKTAQGLISRGLQATKIRESILSLKKKFPDVETQLSDKRIYVFGNRVIISHKNHLIDSHSGQLLLKFDIDSFTDEISQTVESLETKKTAEEWFREGLRYDSDPETYDKALNAYREAVKQRQDFAAAYVNMGTIYYMQRKFLDAQRCFRLAIQREPYHAKAAFNLGNVLDELNCTDEAVQWYERSVESDPNFPDVYYNLAAACERLGQRDRALRHWRAYLSFDSTSKHAQVAKRRIKLLESQLANR